jgi:ABC-type amino acid transport substrate-binding protein
LCFFDIIGVTVSKSIILCLFFFFQQSSLALSLPERVKLSTKIWPPYQYYNNEGKLVGLSVTLLECSFAKLGIDLDIEVVPWSRAQHHTKFGISDGFFSASWNADRDKYATRSINIAPQNWKWYTLKSRQIDISSEKFKQQATIATTRGSNIAYWLRENGYHVKAETLDIDSMIKMVLYGRVDALMANDLVAKETTYTDSEMFKLEKTHGRSMPVSVYFGNEFLNEFSSFLTEINKSIKHCIML